MRGKEFIRLRERQLPTSFFILPHFPIASDLPAHNHASAPVGNGKP
jgi:hypothetical protein